jgi:TolA-binding protein
MIFRGTLPMRLALIALLLAGTAAPALAQSSDASIPARVDRLEKELHAVQRKVFPGGNGQYIEPQIAPPVDVAPAAGTPAQSAVADLTQRVGALEQQIAQLTNTSEQNDHRLTVIEQSLAKLKGDTDYRLGALEGTGAPGGAPPAGANGSAPPFGPNGRKPLPAHVQPAPPPPGDTMAAEAKPDGPAPATARTGDPAEDGYMLGYNLWSQKKFADAEAQLKQVVAKYPDSKRASYAQNLLGRAYMDDGQLTNAADAFLTSYKKFPRGERAADSLYYLGVTLTKLKKTDRACEVYDELRDVYGATINATLKARIAQGRSDAKCGA